MEPLRQIFALLCSRDNCWTPGGEVLPFCQRCTGLYVGAAVALALYAMFRPRPTNLFLWAHGLMLLVMVPFGYHLVPQNGALRTLTGQLFAAGLVGYLALLPAARWRCRPEDDRRGSRAYAAGLFGSLLVLQGLVHLGRRPTGIVLSWLGLLGLVVLAVLVAANGLLLPAAVWRALRRKPVSTAS